MRNGNGRLKPRIQGDLGEVSALEWLVAQGAAVYVPFNSAPDVDLVALFDTRVVRVQVKTSSHRVRGRFEVNLCTSGGNQSWSGVVKRFSPDRCDALFVLAADGRRWYIPASSVEGTRAILLGGPKYADFEIERGQPFGAFLAA